MIAKTNMFGKYQTTIPKEIRKKFGIAKNEDIAIEWDINKKNEVVIKFKKKLRAEDMIGRYKSKKPFNGVELKKKIQKGENI